MNLLPSVEERQWLAHALRKLIAKRGVQLLDEAPLVEPTNEWFPEKWSTTAAHGHRLAQRLLYYAGLGALKPTLSAFVAQAHDEDSPWDAGTAGWFAGIADGHAHFGLHVRQFSDPEAAAGVLAHEVAHAWRAQHRLVIEDRSQEELLTDVTTVVLGFGILTTNNTDRYRSSGTWSVTTWSISSAGYLPPQAMAYLLALWCAARAKRNERRIIEKHLEPNQRACFRAAFEELGFDDRPVRELVVRSAPTRPMEVVSPRAFTPYEPPANELAEPQRIVEKKDPRPVYRTPKGGTGIAIYLGTTLAGVFGLIVGLAVFEDSMTKVFAFTAAVTIAATALLVRPTRREVCSGCGTRLRRDVAVCPGCDGPILRRVSERELKAIRLEEFDRRANRDIAYDECDACEPEELCAVHAAAIEEEEEPVETSIAAEEPAAERVSFRGGRFVLVAALVVLLATVAFAWWRQQHVTVYFDNALARPLTLTVDGESSPFLGRPAMERTLAPGTHRIELRDGARVIEAFDAPVRKVSLVDAILTPPFYVYSAGGAGIYERSLLVYSADPLERTNESELIALQRWIEQEYAEYIFTDSPDSLPSSKATRQSFVIPPKTGFREVAYQWFQRNRADDAVRALKQGLATQPCHEPMRQDIVSLRLANHEEAAARDEARAWAARCDDSIAAHRAYADLLPKEDAISAYRARVAKNPNAVNHYLYGRLLHGAPEIAEMREALRLDASMQWARVALGRELLQTEQDAAAYAELATAVTSADAPWTTPAAYAMAAVAANHIEEAQARLAELDTAPALEARYLLAFAKRDWDQARVLLTEREQNEDEIAITILRARLDVASGASAVSVASTLRNQPETRGAADLIALEDAFANGRFAEATAITDLPDEYLVYVAYASLLTQQPVQVELKEPYALDLLRAARGELTEAAILDRSDAIGDDTRAHAYFALGVHARTTGDRARAAAYFRRSAERALTREFPYGVANAMAAR